MKLSHQKVVVIAIGTEVTSGQISNSNATWLSRKFIELGLSIQAHMSVPDDDALMTESFVWACEQSDLIVLTGGLGPTTDDKTKPVLAKALGVELTWSARAWEHVQFMQSSRGRPIFESHKNLAWFPEGSTLFENSAGSAFAFGVRTTEKSSRLPRERQFIVLPGPPQEIENIWVKGGLGPFVTSLSPGRTITLHTWQTLGPGESEIAEHTEKALRGTGLEIGYRLAQPFVEVKVWVPDHIDATEALGKLEAALAPWIVTRNGEDLAQSFMTHIISNSESKTPILVKDFISRGYLSERLSKFRAELSQLKLRVEIYFSAQEASATASSSDVGITFTLGPWISPEEFKIEFKKAGPNGATSVAVQTCKLPLVSKSPERNERSAAEIALLAWRDLKLD